MILSDFGSKQAENAKAEEKLGRNGNSEPFDVELKELNRVIKGKEQDKS
jgi:hypothetical protein